MRRTKIICTLGPATDQGEVLKDMMKAGMNVARFNFSHGSHEEHKARMDMVKAARAELGLPIGIMLDTKGPEIRTKTYKDGKIEIQEGQEFTLTTRDIEGDNTIVSISYEGLPADVQVGTRILIDDGLVAFEVIEIRGGTDIVCRALNGGPLSNRKSVNVPGIKLNMPYISDKDRDDVVFGCSQGIDFIAASFCRTAQDMKDLKAILKEQNCEDVQIIAKIENMEGVRNIDAILDEVQGIMVARGDLGVEVPFEELPEIQKCLIKKCVSRGKRVVTATQMLESMAKNPRPTRAEVSDVANAVYDGTSAIMLSGETSVGKYPVQTVQTMSRIAENAEASIHYDRRRITRPEFMEMELMGDVKTNAIAHAVCNAATDLEAKCIVAFTESGSTARAVSCRRPGKLIVGATPSEKTFHRLTMSWGVIPCLVGRPSSGTALYMQAVRGAVEAMNVKVGDVIIVTAGMPVGRVSYTNTMRVIQVTEDFINLAFEE
ncbi:pyruvate kinase [Intestinibacillus sp. Marseille-P6563]|uniref:pyruvate kinase n=1 Tax=Intestinibacillus sp. Marseille-P6563 TaxID=2364792 RepID=UPI000F053311|nr:pyruvate kinase [Intestinibacillus sp. Marseille-P6563]